MTPEQETQIKAKWRAKLVARLGEEYLEEHGDYLEAEWEWLKEMQMIDVETDL